MIAIGSTPSPGCRCEAVSTRSRSRYVGKRLDVRVGAETIEVLDGATVVARHLRARKGDEVLALDHYLEVLAIKTGAFPGATALARARAGGCSTIPRTVLD